VVLLWCFCGEDVVGCVAGVVIEPRSFEVLKIRQVLRDILSFSCGVDYDLYASPNSMIEGSGLTNGRS
jgi:hypothetical protein